MPYHEVSGITLHVFQDGGQLQSDESADEGPSNPIAEATRLKWKLILSLDFDKKSFDKKQCVKF